MVLTNGAPWIFARKSLYFENGAWDPNSVIMYEVVNL